MNETSNDPMSFAIDLGGRVDTSKPCPAAGQYVATVVGIEAKPNSKQTGTNLVVSFALDQAVPALPAKDGTPRSCPPGHLITEWLPLQQSDNPKAPDFKFRLCKLFDACMGTDDDTRPDPLPLGSVQGKKVILTLEPESSEDYGFSSKVKKYTFLAQS